MSHSIFSRNQFNRENVSSKVTRQLRLFSSPILNDPVRVKLSQMLPFFSSSSPVAVCFIHKNEKVETERAVKLSNKTKRDGNEMFINSPLGRRIFEDSAAVGENCESHFTDVEGKRIA